MMIFSKKGRGKTTGAFLFLGCLLLGGLTAAGAQSLASSLRFKTVYQETSSPRLADLFESPLGVPELEIPSLGQRPAFFSFSYLRSRLPESLGMVMVGQGLFFLPQHGQSADEVPFVTKLLQFLHGALPETPAVFYLDRLNLPPFEGQDWTFEVVKSTTRGKTWEGAVEIRWKTLGSSVWNPSPLKLQLTSLLAVPKIKKAFKYGQTLTSQDTELAFESVAELGGEPFWLPPGTTWTASQSLSAGEVLLQGAVKRLMDVKKGELVQAVFTKGSLSVELLAKALEEGAVGDSIQVKIEGTQKVYQVQVIGPKEVKNELP